MSKILESHSKLFVKQTFELAELIGFETRNRYRIRDEKGQDVAYAAEQQKSILGHLLRVFLGHWRSFSIHIFDPSRKEILIAKHPFRWYFRRIEVSEANGKRLGTIEKRFSFFSKRFDIYDENQRLLFETKSPIWRPWSFQLRRHGKELARISKKWTGIGFEMFTDKDTFLVDFTDPTLPENERSLILVASLYIDLLFFEKKAD